MAEFEIFGQPIVKPDVKINSPTWQKLLNNVSEETQVVIHCSYTATLLGDRIRIWKSTFLFPRNSMKKCKLVHYEKITLYPTWKQVNQWETVTFSLVFNGLPNGCGIFDLIEQIPEPGGFEIRNIQRNNTDVYFIEIE